MAGGGATEPGPSLSGRPPGAPWEAVLDFWFGRPSDDLQKGLWFCPDGSPEQRAADEEISRRFGGLLQAAEREQLDWASGGPHGIVALIVLLDQIGRHVHRLRGDTADGRPPPESDAAALALCRRLLCDEAAWHGALPAAMQVFALMPLRHDKAGGDLEQQLANHREVLRVLAERVDAHRDSEQRLLERFRSATVRRLQGLQGIAPEGAELLERHEFEPPPEVAEQLPAEGVLRGVARFVAARRAVLEAHGGAVCVSLSGGVDSMVIAHALCHLRDHPRPVARPQRGGKRQVGAAEEAAERRIRRDTFEGAALAGLVRRVVAVHIDYANRHESGREAAFVRDWCERRRIEFRLRVIDEVTRGVTQREEYEEASRRVRYDTYRRCMAEDGVPALCLGHHGDDVVENLLSNANKGCGVMDLSGMREEALVDGVPIWRPLLPFTKQPVFEYAHKYGVPYLKDTTPHWSTRGKLRRQLLPALCDTYGSGCTAHLRSLAAESDALRDLVEARIVQPFWEAAVRVLPCGVRIHCAPYADAGRLFWREAFKRIMHTGLGAAMLAEKAMIEVALRCGLRGFAGSEAAEQCAGVAPAAEPKEGWVELGHNVRGYYRGGVLYILRPQVTARGAEHRRPGAAFSVPVAPLERAATPVRVGRWSVAAWQLPPGEVDAGGGDARCSDKRALPVQCRSPPWDTWESLLEGQLGYLLPLRPAHTGELRVLGPSSLAETQRLPAPWRPVAPQLREALPIAAPVPDDASWEEEECPALVYVRLSYEADAGAAPPS